MTGAGRFDYVKYDKHAQLDQNVFKHHVESLEKEIESRLPNGRGKALALTKLEEVYMWLGKAVRDEQVIRNNGAELEDPCDA